MLTLTKKWLNSEKEANKEVNRISLITLEHQDRLLHLQSRWRTKRAFLKLGAESRIKIINAVFVGLMKEFETVKHCSCGQLILTYMCESKVFIPCRDCAPQLKALNFKSTSLLQMAECFEFPFVDLKKTQLDQSLAHHQRKHFPFWSRVLDEI
jgi:hypothetical protein